jgi:hypothetical protein
MYTTFLEKQNLRNYSDDVAVVRVENGTTKIGRGRSTTAEGSRDGLTSARCCDYSYMCS